MLNEIAIRLPQTGWDIAEVIMSADGGKVSMFRIFFSWQSNLSANQTKCFIRECIDKAIDTAAQAELVEAVRDEATMGRTGFPDIVASIFEKIDECDLFIADVGLCYSSNEGVSKQSPNPNVLLELGYAAKTLGWDRIICICNEKYGFELPFDIAHNRITTYSLEGRTRKEAILEVSMLIVQNICQLRGLPRRAAQGLATYRVGAFDAETSSVIGSLVSISLRDRPSYIRHNESLKEEAKRLVEQIEELTALMQGQLHAPHVKRQIRVILKSVL